MIARRLNKAIWAVAALIDDRNLVSPHFQKLTALVSGKTSIADALAQPEALLFDRTRELVLAP
jgi:hypothetical protein